MRNRSLSLVVLALAALVWSSGGTSADQAPVVAEADAVAAPIQIAGLLDRFRQRSTYTEHLLSMPVATGRFSSGYGMRRNPILGTWVLHAGVDWSAPRGTAIFAAADGVVLSARWESGYGYTTRIRHSDGVDTAYAHQSVIIAGVVAGARVIQGQIIGLVGSTGNATGPHLHFEVSVDGDTVDPLGEEARNALVIGGAGQAVLRGSAAP